MRPVILDFDGSVGPLPDATRVPLRDWEEAIRFGCSRRTLDRLDTEISQSLQDNVGPVFLGSGDFHHVSYALIRRATRKTRLRVVVLDNHPDNMRFPFGIHCGSWVSHVAALPNVSRVDVVGITSSDVSASRLWENRWWPLMAGKVVYWCVGTDVQWASRLGIGAAFRTHNCADALVRSFTQEMTATFPTYLSIDKDVLHIDVAHTNWDQGLLRERHVIELVETMASRLVGTDVTGDVSAYKYRTRWKRYLSAADHQPSVPKDLLAVWQAEQHAINLRLLKSLDRN